MVEICVAVDDPTYAFDMVENRLRADGVASAKLSIGGHSHRVFAPDSPATTRERAA
jgi:hypothetical protein